MLGLLWSLIRGALLLLGHLSGGGSFPKPLSRQEEAQALAGAALSCATQEEVTALLDAVAPV